MWQVSHGSQNGQPISSVVISRGRQFMPSRRTSCSCGQLHLTIEGEPSRISMCHCLACQGRTAAVMSKPGALSA